MVAKAIENLTRLDADHAGGRVYRWMLAMSGPDPNYGTAIAVAREMTTLRQEFAQSFVMLAQAYQANGQYREAIQAYQESMERQTTNIDAYLGIADCYDKQNEPDRAREILDKGMQVFPESVALRERVVLGFDTAIKNRAPWFPLVKKLLAEKSR